MIHQTSLDALNGAEPSASPKRKKVRTKYAPKACMSCRRSKLKCSGDNPCQRCVESGRRCFYSEDQTAAEALQHLSRPTAAQHADPNGTNDNGTTRRSILPRSEESVRRGSDSSVSGLTLEARMTRIEEMMDALLHERTMTESLAGSSNRIGRASRGLQDFSSDGTDKILFSTLRSKRRQALKSANDGLRGPATMPTRIAVQSPAEVHLGTKRLAFPNPVGYERLLAFFFADLSPYYPCVNEADFRLRSDHMLASKTVQSEDVPLLILNYAIFACSEAVLDDTATSDQALKPGWHWHVVADELAFEELLKGREGLVMVQYLILKAVYLVLVDKPDAAYTAIGTACRMSFQLGLHQAASWRHHGPHEIHMRQRVFWTAFILDRRISLSCRKPYCIRNSEVDVEQPAQLYDKDIHPDHPLPNPDPSQSSVSYLVAMIPWAQLAADAWDGCYAAATVKNGAADRNAESLDAQIAHWTDAELPIMPIMSLDSAGELPQIRHTRQYTLVHVSAHILRLFIARKTPSLQQFDGQSASTYGSMAVDIVQRLQQHALEPLVPGYYRFQMATALAHALFALCCILGRESSSLQIPDEWVSFAEAFKQAIAILEDLSTHLSLARRLLEDFADIRPVIAKVIELQQHGQGFSDHPIPPNVNDLLPYGADELQLPASVLDPTIANDAEKDGNSLFELNGEAWELASAATKHQCGVLWL